MKLRREELKSITNYLHIAANQSRKKYHGVGLGVCEQKIEIIATNGYILSKSSIEIRDSKINTKKYLFTIIDIKSLSAFLNYFRSENYFDVEFKHRKDRLTIVVKKNCHVCVISSCEEYPEIAINKNTTKCTQNILLHTERMAEITRTFGKKSVIGITQDGQDHVNFKIIKDEIAHEGIIMQCAYRE